MYGFNPIIEIIYGREIVGIRDVKNQKLALKRDEIAKIWQGDRWH